MEPKFAPLLAAVRKNCNIADALHAGDYTMCVYLLKMREYFRWEKGYTFSTPLPHGAVGDWLKQREQQWEGLEQAEFERLPLAGSEHDPFDSEILNDALNPQGFVYSAGLGQGGRPHFFLARLERREVEADFTLYIAAEELARDLAAPPAMSLGNTIYVRRESVRRMLWERIEEWRWNCLDNPMGRAMACYPFGSDDEYALAQMTEEQISVLLRHEIGEVLARKILGDAWETLLTELPRSRTELAVRAVRDHLADSLSTLPALLATGSPANIHFFIATLSPMRKLLAPSLMQAYQHWHDTQSTQALTDYAEQAQSHWAELGHEILRVHAGSAATEDLQRLIDAKPL